MARLALWLLGPFQVTLDGQPVTAFATDKVRALLAYLAVESARAHPRETLTGLLWPDYPESSARQSLSQSLFILRGAIRDPTAQPPHLLVTRDTLQIDPQSDHWLDVSKLQEDLATSKELPRAEAIARLEGAVALYRGPFLEGLSCDDCGPFEEWTRPKREEYHRRALAALQRLAELQEQGGDYASAQRWARRQVELEPTDEGAHRQLMRALALGGQRNAALAQYEACRRLLADELGVEPAPETTALYQHIRQGALVAVSPATTHLLPSHGPSSGRELPEAPRAPFVARERELARLGQVLAQALSGEGQVVFVIGEPGSGKTTLVQEFAQRAMAAHADLVVASGNCNAYTGIGDPYLPFVEALRALGGDSTASRGAITHEHARRLEALLPATLQALLEVGPVLLDVMVSGAALLARAEEGLADGPLWRARVEEALRRRGTLPQSDLFAQYTRVLQALSREHPLLLFLDDLQWADAGSLSLLFHLGRRLAGYHILVVGAYRSEEVALGRDGQPHPLEPVVHEFQRVWGDIHVDLAEAEGRRLVEEIIASQPNRLDAAFGEALYQHTGGQALFTVELLRGLQARGHLVRDEAGRWVQGPALDWRMLPTQIESVIAQQIGRLPAEWQALLTVASVEGEEFTAEVVARAQGVDEREITRALNGALSKQHHLVDAQCTQILGAQRLSRYRFRHHLFQQYLYQSLNAVERQRRHEEVGQALEGLYGAVSEFFYEGWPVVEDRLAALYSARAVEVASILPQLAWHYRVAGLVEKAAAYLSQAAFRAARCFAPKEAIAHASQGVALLQPLPLTLARARQEMAFQTTLAFMFGISLGASSPGASQAKQRVCALARMTGDDVHLLWGVYGLANLHFSRAEYHAAIELAEEMLALAQRAAPDQAPDAHILLGILWATVGRIALAREHVDPLFGAIPGPGTLRSWPQHGRFTPDVPAVVYWLAGQPDQALRIAEMGLSLALPDHAAYFRLAYIQVHQLRREAQAALEGAQAMLPETTEERAGSQHAAALYWEGWAQAQLGQSEEGIASMRQALGAWEQRGTALWRAYWLAGLAEGYALAGQPEEGLRVIAEALQHVERTDERWYEAELYRLKGALLGQRGDDPAQGETCFRQAIVVAQTQEARSWELRATVSLARLWQAQGKTAEAREMLAAIYGWFNEGFDTPDLQEAKALLDALP